MGEREGDNGAIVALYTHGFQPNVTQLSRIVHCVRESLHTFILLSFIIDFVCARL